MNETIQRKFTLAKEENDFVTIAQLAKEYPIPSELREELYEVCFYFYRNLMMMNNYLSFYDIFY